MVIYSSDANISQLYSSLQHRLLTMMVDTTQLSLPVPIGPLSDSASEASAKAPASASATATATATGKVRQRASHACLNCRVLKIKCVFLNKDDTQCKRCKCDETDCVFVSSKRGRHNKKRKKQQKDEPNLQEEIKKKRLVDHLSPFTRDPSIDQTTTSLFNDSFKSEPSIEVRRPSDDKSISVTRIQNPSDSLNLLAQAAFRSDSESSDSASDKNSDANSDRRSEGGNDAGESTSGTSVTLSDFDSINNSNINFDSSSKETILPNSQFKERLSKFCLVEAGIVSPITLKTLIYTYFSRHHQYMPIIPGNQVLRSDSELCTLVENEPILSVAFVIIASRFEDEKVHRGSWKYMSAVINDLVLGIRKPTLGAIEALLTLSENVPKCDQINDMHLYEFEERFSWHLVGQAVRMSYYLGLDQKTLLTTDETMSPEAHRKRFIWTYCHLEERQTSIRFGKAFWSRGPTLCFPSAYVNSPFGPSSFHSFPTLVPSVNSLEDYSSYTQALIDSTNLLSNIHDLLYPSRDRTISLVHLGDYHKILDELTMGFATYKMTWEKKYWDTLSLNETVWISFNYAKLYAYGFAFEAHMKRMTDASSQRLDSQSMFPMSMSATPDAKFIIEAKNAAIEILTSCVDNLHTFGVMAYLPARYYGYFSHAAVFLIKAIFTNAVHLNEQKQVLQLIRRSISCFCDEFKGLDRYHPLIRCAQELRTLIHALWTSRDDNKENMNENNNQFISTNQNITTESFNDNNSLTDDIFDLVGDFSFEEFFGPGEAAVQDLTSTFSNDLNGDYWLSYFNP